MLLETMYVTVVRTDNTVIHKNWQALITVYDIVEAQKIVFHYNYESGLFVQDGAMLSIPSMMNPLDRG